METSTFYTYRNKLTKIRVLLYAVGIACKSDIVNQQPHLVSPVFSSYFLYFIIDLSLKPYSEYMKETHAFMLSSY